ncbi:hypothetical protein N7457_009194 [Penicillium paradoxum]|uniref:uncharacterized protein n=1 Tax=Penicillium paradoxum TaxID=176176 RepID=UPI002549B367|nr:uncharacterized protein N7457_009194 [Penicillium paradoxum]KAJ5774298.1 hypothetical protein N7457_009194 [Penicillium paradoxum]
MAARTLSNMRKAQSLLRECHNWLVENNETLLAIEFCRIEGELALLFERKCFTTSPCVGLPPGFLHLGPRRRNNRGSGNGGQRPPANKASSQGPPVSRTSGRQNPPPRARRGGSGNVQNAPPRPTGQQNPSARDTANRLALTQGTSIRSVPTQKAIQAPPVKKAPPPTGVLVNFNDDVEFVKLLPSMVAEMETVKAHLEPKDRQSLSERPATVSSAEPASGVSTEDTPVCSHRRPPVAEGSVAPALSLEDSIGTGVVETFPEFANIGAPTEGVLIDLAEDITVVLPAESDVDTDNTTPSAKEGVPAAELDIKFDESPHSVDPENEDEIVFRGGKVPEVGREFRAVFVSTDIDPETVRSALDLREVLEKYSEVVICK